MGRISSCAAALAFFVSAAAGAHHSVAAEFDISLQGELRGVITHVWFTNPHVRYRLEVARDDGTVERWELQGGNVTNLRRMNWTRESLRVGDVVTVHGDLGRDGAKKLWSARDDAIDLTEQAPCDPDSHYRDLTRSGRLEAHFEQ